MVTQLTDQQIRDIVILSDIITFDDIPKEEHRRLKRARKIVDQEEIE